MKKVILLLLNIFVVLNCSRHIKKDILIENNIEIRLERGAFHYDTFVLKDTVIQFFPEKSNHNSFDKTHKISKYDQKSKQSISKKQLLNFITKIDNDSLWNLKEKYNCNTSCSSILKIYIKLDDKVKTISCEDYQCGCPKILQDIENEIIKLHQKNLNRINLPG